MEISPQRSDRQAGRARAPRPRASLALEQLQAEEDSVIAAALAILARRVGSGPLLTSPNLVKDFLRCQFAQATQDGREEFGVLLLDAQNRLISFKTLFYGTLTQTSVYPREVVKLALASNAGAVVLAHNHPSADPTPSRADEFLTQTLKSALQLVDVRVLDHFVVGNDRVCSFAERGLL